MGMGPLPMFGAVPTELGFRPIVLQYTLGPGASPSFPVENLPFAEWRRGPWDPDVLSLIHLTEFARQNWDDHNAFRADILALPPPFSQILDWENVATAQNYTNAEINLLMEYMQNDRERYLPEILAQHDNAPAYWGAMLGINRSNYPNTLVVLHLAVRIGQLVAAYYKHHFDRARPSYVCPGLLPPFGPPAHTSFPSGHALQSWLLTRLLSRVAPSYSVPLRWLARRVALNRERAGLHYPSDTIAGRLLAGRCRDIIVNQCPGIMQLVAYAQAEW